ncbi:thioesterase family protein [Leisingera sp. F5]|uniref:thioesterase family protein n=1 Tax=Leisingera sp. F5 TaxID=1813816 RepID=UPI000B29AD6D|nr:thioesterase family protein [Leisingera sp. F5]
MLYSFETSVLPEWIDYNGHMRDSYYGLVFSLAVDAFQDEVGFDEAYRRRTGCTIYLLEDHKFFLREVKEGARVRVETRIVGCDSKRFHLHMQMFNGTALASVGEFMELHVCQHPQPHAMPMPEEILQKLEAARLSESEAANLPRRSRGLSL